MKASVYDIDSPVPPLHPFQDRGREGGVHGRCKKLLDRENGGGGAGQTLFFPSLPPEQRRETQCNPSESPTCLDPGVHLWRVGVHIFAAFRDGFTLKLRASENIF